ncbi:MAG: VTT domain-containing protein, partial [Candidatus Gastranaerophilales bacterium]|nr:VTT domain-containing protein [Candidatus Gastranaerophilales bacterium]
MKSKIKIKHKISKKQINMLVLLGLIIVVVLCIYGWKCGIFKDITTLRSYISLHFLQIIIPFIPGGVVQTAGVVCFGPWPGFWLNYIGIAIGSITSFALARHYGQAFVRSKVSQEVWHKYFRWLDNGKIFPRFFAIAILLP